MAVIQWDLKQGVTDWVLGIETDNTASEFIVRCLAPDVKLIHQGGDEGMVYLKWSCEPV